MASSHAYPLLADLSHLTREARIVRRALANATSGERDRYADELSRLMSQRTTLIEAPEHRELLDRALTERAKTLRRAVELRRRELAARALEAEADALVDRAVTEKRPLTPGERDLTADLRARARSERTTVPGAIHSPEQRDDVLVALATVRLREARAQLRNGLLLTAQMRQILAEARPSVLRGEPVLLLGETGGAKTALAEYLSRQATGRTAELISGYGDITSSQLIGSHELRVVDGATVTEFSPGPLLRALIDGRPVILDEINAMPAEFLKRLNRILQLRPGDTLSVQENGGAHYRVAEGFAIVATANEQTPHRYRGLDRLSSELVNRFGAGSYRVHYPDAGTSYTGFPRENTLLAAASVIDERGELPDGITEDGLRRAARAAFISQQVFSGEHGDGFGEYVSTEREIDGRPGLEENVIAPRTLVAILQKVASSAGSISLDHAFGRFVEGVMHPEDRRVLEVILSGQNFRLRRESRAVE